MARERKGPPPGITVRVLADGSERFDVRYRLPNGASRRRSFDGITAAKAFQATTRADKARGGLVDPQRGRIHLDDYATHWIDTRGDLRPRTVELYRSLLRLHITPALGGMPLAKITPEAVRTWHRDLLKADAGAPTVAKAYRLLRAILNTAVADGRIIANPCQIAKAGAEKPTERPTVTPAEVRKLADAVPPARRPMVLLAGFCGLRLGEVLGLAVRHVDLLHNTLTVDRQLQEVAPSGAQVFAEPKSDAGRRVIPLPAVVADALRGHLEAMADAGPTSLLFTGDRGGPLRRHVFHTEWATARKTTGLTGLRFHDLRHSALTLYAATGATIAELQAHAGHSTADAALRYQHATKDRARALAELVDKVIEADAEAASGGVRAINAPSGAAG
jgi:integrase